MDILVVNHNQPKFTIDLIEDLKSQTYGYNLTLVNNGCDDDKVVSTQIGEVENLNWNAPLNQIWNVFAKQSKADYICFLNNDVRITDNFVEDTVRIFEKEPKVGLVIHVTNNTNCIKAGELHYKVLDIPLCQGWDFSIRRNIYPEISPQMKIFGGDDYIFAKVVSRGWKVAIAISSPILHYKEKTREIVKYIDDIQANDQKHFCRILKYEGLNVVPNTTAYNISEKYCNVQTEQKWLNSNNKLKTII